MEDLSSKFKSDVITKGKEPVIKEDCIFCKISRGEATSSVLFKNSEVTVFYDIRPAAKEHLLIIPNCHHGNPKTLTKADIPMVEYLHDVGQGVLEQKGGSLDDAKVGFHWPPFNTVEHLHLHMAYPASSMKLFSSLMYRNNSPWFVTYDWLLQRLKNLPDATSVRPEQSNPSAIKEANETIGESSGKGTEI
ncbi:histidine triad nucleotide-binding protein 3-like isoform X1 [Acanthaster planci]|uniref:Adenosine 5'-monophosphoramidase HINT3 n=1 Tax=Acanthaster planci TaxID=133434 RepID=A0A8B7YII5_ACAPL|nr:histidine triad nucleotide-binding protein 3-like isoform X1 [Acanthaster planci]